MNYFDQYSQETRDNLEATKNKGINLYALIHIYRSRSKISPAIPEEVINKLTQAYLQTDAKLDHSFGYFIKVLQIETEKYFSEQNELEGKQYKKRAGFSSSIKELLSIKS